MIFPRTFTALLIGAASPLGCKSESGECQVVSSMTLTDDEKSPSGTSPAELLQLSKPENAAFLWDLGLDGSNPTNAGIEEEVSVAVTTERASGSAQYVVTEQVGNTEQDGNCGPSLHVPVRLSLTTSDGALEEAFEADLILRYATGVASFDSSFAFEDLNGWLTPVAAGADGEVHAEFGEEVRGWVAVVVTLTSDGAARENWTMAGHWGDVAPPEDAP